MQKPLVSVVVVTYNQEKYIGQALDSILMQKVDFPIEILIGDDCSDDRTATIVRDYEKKYPSIITAFYREKNLGSTRNAYEMYLTTKGKYIANLEGDDYWIDEKKLQKQVDFLEKNANYICCCSDFVYVDLNGIPFDETRSNKMKRDSFSMKEVFSLSDWNDSHLPSHPNTWVYRNIFKTGEDTSIVWKAHPIAGDTTIGLLLAAKGDLYTIPEKMACYRRAQDTGSSWTSSTSKNPFYLYDLFMYHTRLEEYAKDVLGVKATLNKSKSYEFYHFVEMFLRDPGQAQWNCIWKMFSCTRKKMPCIKMFIQSIFLYTVPPVIRNMFLLTPAHKLYGKLNREWKDFYRDLRGKTLVLYGAGGGCFDLLKQYYDRLPVQLIIDNGKKQGSYAMGYKIRPFEYLNKFEKDNIVVLITSGMYYTEIASQLENEGYKHYYVYPVMERKRLRYWPLRFFAEDMQYLRD